MSLCLCGKNLIRDVEADFAGRAGIAVFEHDDKPDPIDAVRGGLGRPAGERAVCHRLIGAIQENIGRARSWAVFYFPVLHVRVRCRPAQFEKPRDIAVHAQRRDRDIGVGAYRR